MTVPTPDPLDAVELVLAAAAAVTVDELAVVRLAALRAGVVLTVRVPGAPDPGDPRPAGVHLLGGMSHMPHVPLTVSARLGRISRRTAAGEAVDDPFS